MREPLVELLVEIPGLPVQVGRFRRVGIFDLTLAQALNWKVESDGYADEVWIGPTDWAWRCPGNLKLAGWFPGCTVSLNPGDLNIHVDPEATWRERLAHTNHWFRGHI